jgi:hypothetical protein
MLPVAQVAVLFGAVNGHLTAKADEVGGALRRICSEA